MIAEKSERGVGRLYTSIRPLLSFLARNLSNSYRKKVAAQFNKGKIQRKTIVDSCVRCLENNQLVITSAFPTVNFRK